MACNEYYKTDYNVENSTFCFFEFFLITPWDQYKPSCVYDEDNTDHWEECIEKREEFPDYSYTTSEIYLFDITSSNRYKSSYTILTSRASIEWSHYGIWDFYKQETYDGIDDSIIWFFDLFFITSSRYSREKSPYCHE